MSIYSKAQELESQGISFAVVTLIAHRGHAPQDPGAKAIVTALGLELGTIGGGKVEAKAIALVQEILAKEKIEESERLFQVKWNLQKDVGMTCGGEVEFLFEISSSARWQIIVFGAGHIAQSLVPLLLTLDCHVTCVDTRQEWLDKLPVNSLKLRKICAVDMPAASQKLSQDAFYVLMTQGHGTDLPILKEVLLNFMPPYIGVIGSQVKALKVRKELEGFGVASERVQALRCPMGFPIGNNEPAEIAISIAAQLLEVRAQVFSETKWKF
jgi:xanthine dehydrogenase accessory factor